MNFNSKSQDVGTFDLDYAEIEEYLGKKESTVYSVNSSLEDKGFLRKINPYKFEVTNWQRYILRTKKENGGEAFNFQYKENGQSLKTILQNLGINFQLSGKESSIPTDSSVTPNVYIRKLLRDNINTNTLNKNFEEEKTNEKANVVQVDVGGSDIEKNEIYQNNSKYKDPRNKNIASQFPKWVLIQQEPRTDQEYQSIQDEQSDDMKMTIEDMKWIDQNASGFVKVEDEEKEKWAVEIYFGGDQAKYKNYLEPSITRAIINYYPKIG